MPFLDDLNAILEDNKKRNININTINSAHNITPLQNQQANYTNENDLSTLAQAFGIGASNMVNNTVLGGGGQLLGSLGRLVEAISPWSGDDGQELRSQLILAGIPLEKARELTPHQDSWLTSLGKSALDAHNFIDKGIQNWRNDVLGDNPTYMAQVLEGTGSSVGFMGTGAAVNALAGPLAAAIAMGGTEALSESGATLADAYKQGQYDQGLATAGKSFITNAGLNSALNIGLGPFAGHVAKMRNPITRFGLGTVEEVINELIQEPSQQTIEKAALRDIYNGEDFMPALLDEGGNWWNTAKQLAPSVAGSTLLTQLITGGGNNFYTRQGRQNLYDQYRNRHVDIEQAKKDLDAELERHTSLRQNQADIQEDIARLAAWATQNQENDSYQSQLQDVNSQLQASQGRIDALLDSLKPENVTVEYPNVESKTVRDLRGQIQIEQKQFNKLKADLDKMQDYDGTPEADLIAQRLKVDEANTRLSRLNQALRNARNGIYTPNSANNQGSSQGDNSYSPNSQNIIFNNAPKGKINSASTEANGQSVDSNFAIVEAPTIIASNMPSDGANNPNYTITQAQNRNRASQNSQESVIRMASNLNPNYLGDSFTLQYGAPLVTADGQVVTGNKRAMAIQRAYLHNDSYSAEKYKHFLIQHAKEFGLNPDYVKGLKSPMLVRVLSPNANLAQITSIGNKSNYSTTEAFSASENALDDMKKLDEAFWTNFKPDEDLDHKANRDAVSSFLSNLPESQRNGFLNGDRLSDAGLRRIHAALQAYAYNGDSSIISRLQKTLASEDKEKNITKALEQSAPILAKLQHFFEQNPNARNDYDILRDIFEALQNTKAANGVSEAGGSEQTVDSMNATLDLDNTGLIFENFKDTAKSIAGFLARNKRNPGNIIEFLTRYANSVMAQDGDNQLSIGEKPTKEQLLTWAMANSDKGYAKILEEQQQPQRTQTQQTAPQQQQQQQTFYPQQDDDYDKFLEDFLTQFQQPQQTTQQQQQTFNPPQDARLQVINARENPQSQQDIRQQSGEFFAYTDEQKKARIAPMQSRQDTRGIVPDAYTDAQTQQDITGQQAGRIEGYQERDTRQPDKPRTVEHGLESQSREPFIQPKNRASEQQISQGNEASTTPDTGEIWFDKHSGLIFYSPRNSTPDTQGISNERETLSTAPELNDASSIQQAQQDSIQRHVEAFKAILRDLYNNGNGETEFDIKPFWDYEKENNIDAETADKIFKELEKQGVMRARAVYSPSWDFQSRFPSDAYVSIIDAKNLAPTAITPQNQQANQRLDRAHDVKRDTQSAQANQSSENTTTPRNDIQQSQQQKAEIHRHVETIKGILRDLYNNSNGDKQFDMKPIRDYISRNIHDNSIADSVLQALDDEGIGYVQDDMTFFPPDKDFPSGEYFNISNPDNLAPRELPTHDNSKTQNTPHMRDNQNVPKKKIQLVDGRMIEFRVQSKNERLGDYNPRSHEAITAPHDGYVGDFTITQAHGDNTARMYLGQQDGKPIIGVTDENGNFLGHYDPINDTFTAYDEKIGLARLAEAELKRHFTLELGTQNSATPAQILDEVIRRDFKQKADDAGRNSAEAENVSRVFMKQLEYLSKWSKKSAWDLYKALNIKIQSQQGFFKGKKRGETIFGETSTIINLFKDADASTLLHETGHIFLHTLEKLDRAGLLKGKNNRAALDWGTIKRTYGLTDIDFSEALSEADLAKLLDAHEQFATSLEKYFLTGKNPVAENSKMFHVFKSFKQWLGRIYQAAKDIMFTDSKGRKKSVTLDRDIKELFDRIFSDTSYKPKATTTDFNLRGDNLKFLQSERGERGGFFKWLKNLGSKALHGLASIAHSSQKSYAYDYTQDSLLSAETIRRITEASKPLPRGNILARTWHGAKKIAQSITGGDFAAIANAPDAKERGLLDALEFLRQGQRQKKKAVDDALKSFRENLRGLNKKQLNLFNTYRILDDLMFQIQNMPNSALPFGLDEKTLRAEHARLSPIVKADSQVAQAIQSEEDTMKQYHSDYVKYGSLLGLDFSPLFKNPHYYRHKIIEYAQAARMGNPAPSARGNLDIQGYADATMAEIFGRDWRKKRKGSTLDFLTDYIQANSEVRMQMAQDIENMKTLLQLKKQFDIAPRLLERLKQRRKKNAPKIDTTTESYSQSDNDEALTIFDMMTDEERKKYQLFNPAGSRLIEGQDSAKDNLIRMAADDIAEQTGIPLDKVLLAWGLDEDSEEKIIAFPNEVVEELRNLAKKRHRGMLGQVAKDLTTWWKRSVLFSPFRNLKYNLRNFTGDLDALIAGNPRALKQLPKAFKELVAHYMKGKNEGYKPSKELQEYIDRSAGLGIQSLNLSARDAQAILNMIQDMESPSKIKKGWNTLMKPIRAFFSAEHSFTEWREHLLRYAAYLDYKQQMEQNQDGKPNNWGASLEDEVMSLDDIRDRAFKMSNELLGAYDQISETGKQLRDMLVPFYSWIEVNMRRYSRLFKNAIKGGNTKNLLGQIMLGKTAAIPAYAVSASMSLGQLALFTLATQMFNRFIWPDADDDLPEDVKYRPHITLGKNGNDVYYFDRIGALADVLDWASLDSIALDAKDFANGQLTVGGWFKKILQAPVSKTVNSLNPGIKLPIELAMGRSMFPNVFKPSTIRDPAMYVAKSFGLSWPYKAVAGIPHDSMQELTNIGIYSVDADEAAYFQTLDRVRQFQNTVLDKHFDGFAVTQRGRILQKIKTALRYNDNKALQQFLREYTQADGTKKGLQQSMKAMHPLHSLSKKEREQFLRWISPDDRKYLRKAERYFRQLTSRFIH